jgi:hypothetical protein
MQATSEQRQAMISIWFLFVGALLLLQEVPIATATYSIVSTDATTRQVGGAGATCLPDRDVFEALYLSVPNRSVLLTQGWLLPKDDPIILTALDMMQQTKDESVDDILDKMLEMDDKKYALKSGEVYVGRDMRQYGIADFDHHNAHTGSKLTELWEKLPPLYYDGATITGNDEETDQGGQLFGNSSYVFHAMGNVVKVGTVDAMANAFQNSENNDNYDYEVCDMAGKLMAALESVFSKGLGDVRCLDDDESGYSTTGAYLHVDNADGTERIHINVISDGTEEEPVEGVKRVFLEWRKDHSCEDMVTSGASTRGRWMTRSSVSSAVLLPAICGLLSMWIL